MTSLHRKVTNSSFIVTKLFGILGMARVIKVSDSTYEKLARMGEWSDTMDSIIQRLLKRADIQKASEGFRSQLTKNVVSIQKEGEKHAE